MKALTPDRCIFKVKQVKVFHLDPGVREKRSQTPPSTLGRILAFRNCAIKCELNAFKKIILLEPETRKLNITFIGLLYLVRSVLYFSHSISS